MKSLSLAALTTAETRVGGTYDGDVRWNAEDGPFIVTSDILVTETGRLTISPGARIVIDRPIGRRDSIRQIDELDARMISIKVKGSIRCMGRRYNRITFAPAGGNADPCSWYGLVLDDAYEQYTEISFADVAGACYGITVLKGRPVVRNCVFEYNNVGVNCANGGNAIIYNTIVAYNFITGMLVRQSNPTVTNCIIAFNRNNGIWGDVVSRLALTYSCVWGNPDGNLLDCDPALCRKTIVNKNRDSTDNAGNLCVDPVFAGSPADSAAWEKDVRRSTDAKDVRDPGLGELIRKNAADSSSSAKGEDRPARYWLSTYSPCRNAGDPARLFNDLDGSRNDLGIHGGPDFYEVKEK